MDLKGKMPLKRKFYEDREGMHGHQKSRKLEKGEKAQRLSSKSHREKEKFGMMEMDEEAMLEKLVLGDLSSMLEKLGDDNDGYPRLNMDTESDSGVEEGIGTPDEEEPSTSGRQPAWHDEEDSDLCIQDALKQQNRKRKFTFPGNSSDSYTGILKQRFNNIVGTPKWAQLGEKEDDEDNSSDSDDEILRHCGKFISKSHSALPRETLRIKRVYDLNSNTNCEGPIVTAVQFHPKSTVALVAGLSGIASIVQVDGEKNEKLHSIQFQRFPVSTAKFTTDGNNFLVGSRELPYYYRYDMLEGRTLKVQPQAATPITNFKHFQISPDGQVMAVAGRFGNIYLLSVRTGECIATLKMNGEVNVLAFNADGSRLFSHGDSGMVYVWDVGSRSCLFQFYDDGCISGTALAVSPNGQYVATGSAQGVVNVYESSSLVKSNGAPTPAKILYNLTTSITSLTFNANSEILAMASSFKDNAIRMVHFPSMTVFNNFPGWVHNLSRPHATDFSLQSGYFSATNNKNTAYLFRLGHYGNY